VIASARKIFRALWSALAMQDAGGLADLDEPLSTDTKLIMAVRSVTLELGRSHRGSK
jgi:hypothetical protein